MLPIAAPLVGPRAVRRLGSPGSRVGRWVGLRRLREDEIAIYLRQFEEPERVEASVALYRDAQLHAVRLSLLKRFRTARLQVPTLHLHGTEDNPTHPVLIETLRALSGHFQLELLHGLGHFLLDEAPQRVNPAVRAFLMR